MPLHSPHIRKEVDLSAFNTLGIHATAAGFIEITHRDQLPVLVRRGLINRGKYYIWGGGSNVLFKKRLEVIVIRSNIPGIREESLPGADVRMYAGVCVNRHEVVSEC